MDPHRATVLESANCKSFPYAKMLMFGSLTALVPCYWVRFRAYPRASVIIGGADKIEPKKMGPRK